MLKVCFIIYNFQNLGTHVKKPLEMGGLSAMSFPLKAGVVLLTSKEEDNSLCSASAFSTRNAMGTDMLL